MGSEYEDAKSRIERYFFPCDDNTSYDEQCILPPVTKIANKGHAVLHSLVCAFGARIQKNKKCCRPPKSMWYCSVESLIKRLTEHTGQEANWSIDSINEVISKEGIGLSGDEDRHKEEANWSIDSINEVISKEGIGLSGDEDRHKEYCAKYRDLWIETYDLSISKTYDHLCDEIKNNGPIVAIIQPDEDFDFWSSKSAKEKIYNGYDDSTLHAVTLIGSSSYHDDWTTYFIAQNCNGEEWGDKGTFRLLPFDIVELLIPVVPPY